MLFPVHFLIRGWIINWLIRLIERTLYDSKKVTVTRAAMPEISAGNDNNMQSNYWTLSETKEKTNAAIQDLSQNGISDEMREENHPHRLPEMKTASVDQ